jgi:hypothetical protein
MSNEGASGSEPLPLDAIVGFARDQIRELLDSTARPREQEAVDAIASPDAERQGER